MSWIVSIALVFFALFSALTYKNAEIAASQNVAGEARAVSASMVVYKDHVSAYAKSHPGFAGAVNDSALGLPTWYRKASGIQHYMVAGAGYVYLVSAPPAVVSQLASDAGSLIRVGLNVSGQLVSPVSGPTGMFVPAQVPNGALVYAD